MDKISISPSEVRVVLDGRVSFDLLEPKQPPEAVEYLYRGGIHGVARAAMSYSW